MPLTLTDVLPNSASGLSHTGFLFGAGTSAEAGYPMMPELTRTVINALSRTQRQTLDDALAAASIAYDDATATPNIEIIADRVMEHAVNSGEPRFTALEEELRKIVTEVILSVSNPTLDLHVRFLTSLRRRTYGQAVCIYILTTNYDVLFELAGAQAGVFVETGFIGSVERFFDQQRFNTRCGALMPQNRFSEHTGLTVRLIKLHGSVSWTTRGGSVFERHPSAIDASEKRVMILPRRRKTVDALQPPHDVLFGVTSRALGTECKYIASCGFSYGDEHINHDLLIPALNARKIRLFALCGQETDGMATIKATPAFSACFSSGGIAAGMPHSHGGDQWKFSQFVNLFE